MTVQVANVESYQKIVKLKDGRKVIVPPKARMTINDVTSEDVNILKQNKLIVN